MCIFCITFNEGFALSFENLVLVVTVIVQVKLATLFLTSFWEKTTIYILLVNGIVPFSKLIQGNCLDMFRQTSIFTVIILI